MREGREHTAGGAETGDIVVGRLQAIGSAGQRSRLGHDGYTEWMLVEHKSSRRASSRELVHT